MIFLLVFFFVCDVLFVGLRFDSSSCQHAGIHSEPVGIERDVKLKLDFMTLTSHNSEWVDRMM